MDNNHILIQKCVASFNIAAKEFALDIIAPFQVNEDGLTHTAIAFLPCIGSEYGMIVSSIAPPDFNTCDFFVEYAKRHNMYISHINIESYSSFSKELFEEAFNDWGYYGNRTDPPRDP